MIPDHSSRLHFLFHLNLSVLTYVALVITLTLTTLLLAADIMEKYAARADSLEILAKLEERAKLSHSGHGEAAEFRFPSSPYLEESTITLARAALLQRVISAIASAGGMVVSSEIDTQGLKSKDDFLRVIATCEVEESALQNLLYDIESGMPFLLIEQMVAQVATSSNENKRIRVVLGVSAVWSGPK
jgi:general secretion pathway protein M